MVTIYENIYSNNPHYISVDAALARIKSGKSKHRIDEIRACLDKDKADAIKRQLPSVCFSGKFKNRKDEELTEHSGFLVMDFDEVGEIDVLMAELANKPFVYACWLSPRGNGVKALVRLADGKKHRLHFAALKSIFPNIDKSGINESRVCYESYDPFIHINPKAVPFTEIVEVERYERKDVIGDEAEIFKNLLKWLTNKGDAFVKGERNIYIFKLASSCCRFGIYEDNAIRLILSEYPPTNDFSQKECIKAIESAYKKNANICGTAQFDKGVLVERTTRNEVKIDTAEYENENEVRDVVYGAMVKANALKIYQYGYDKVDGIGVPELDELFKDKRGELTCLTGIGNYGKSTMYKWKTLMRVLKYGEKFASFSPEDNPPEEYYHDFVEMLLGCDCTPRNNNIYSRPKIEVYSNAYDFVSNHIFYLYPKDLSPTPEYVKERFLSLIMKEKVSGVAIDPFNQMVHDYSINGGRTDQYLETVLGDLGRFAVSNGVYFTIVMHPKQLQKNGAMNYPCPDVFDLAGGAMWNNKMDNILVYHRPYGQSDPTNRECELHTKKIRRQKVVGQKGVLHFEYVRSSRRYEIGGKDYMSELLRLNGLDFHKPVIDYKPVATKIEEDAPF